LRLWKMSAAGLALIAWCWTALEDRSALHLTIVPLNGGCASYFDAPGVKNELLIDCGAEKSVQSIMTPFLRAQGVNQLEAMLLTHGEVRHVGGAAEVADLFSVDKIYVSPVRFRSTVYRQLMERLSSPPGLLHTISRPDPLGSWLVLHPERDDHFPQADDNALVLLGNLAGTRILLLSDLGRTGQNTLLQRTPDLRADIVVASLPTQTEALSDSLLDAIQPRVIIVVDSEFPVTGRASAKLRDRLARRNVPVIYTRTAGAVTLELQAGRWQLRTMDGQTIKGNSLSR